MRIHSTMYGQPLLFPWAKRCAPFSVATIMIQIGLDPSQALLILMHHSFFQRRINGYAHRQ